MSPLTGSRRAATDRHPPHRPAVAPPRRWDRAPRRGGNRVFGQSPRAGALPTLYAATAPGVRPDSFTGPSFAMWRGAPAESWRARRTRDDAAAERLREESERLTGVAYGALKA